MASWYAHLVFKGSTLLGEGLADPAQIGGVAPPDGGEPYTLVIVSGYALYGELRGYYALGAAHLAVDPASGKAHYVSEASALHNEPAASLTVEQRAAIRDWLAGLSPSAWENSTESFRQALESESALSRREM